MLFMSLLSFQRNSKQSPKCIFILLYRALSCGAARATAAGAQKLNKDLKNTQQQHSNATRHKIDQRSLSSIYTVVVVQGEFWVQKMSQIYMILKLLMYIMNDVSMFFVTLDYFLLKAVFFKFADSNICFTDYNEKI